MILTGHHECVHIIYLNRPTVSQVPVNFLNIIVSFMYNVTFLRFGAIPFQSVKHGESIATTLASRNRRDMALEAPPATLEISDCAPHMPGGGGGGGGVAMFPGSYVPPHLCSPAPMFPGTDVPPSNVPQYLCSPAPMFPCPIFPGTYVPQYLYSPVPMLPRPMFPSAYVPPYLCSPVPMFPRFTINYYAQYICSPFLSSWVTIIME